MWNDEVLPKWNGHDLARDRRSTGEERTTDGKCESSGICRRSGGGDRFGHERSPRTEKTRVGRGGPRSVVRTPPFQEDGTLQTLGWSVRRYPGVSGAVGNWLHKPLLATRPRHPAGRSYDPSRHAYWNVVEFSRTIL